MEIRKRLEKEFHNILRTVNDDENVTKTRWDPELETTIKNNILWANMKYYSIERKSRFTASEWFINNCEGKRVLDYCCGNGDDVLFIAQNGAKEVIGIDISDSSIENCIKKHSRCDFNNISFMVMDGEALGFADESFDIVVEYGSLHHVNLEKAYAEIARVLRPHGKAICVEALGHNAIIHLYRKLTPHLRTEWEIDHILKKEQIEFARTYFHKVDIIGFYHLATLGAVPFRNYSSFNKILAFLENFDELLLKLPVLKWQAWQVIFQLSEPRKGATS